MKDLTKLNSKIYHNFHQDNYSKVISLIDEYMSIPGSAMYDMLAFYYGTSLYCTGNKKLAHKYLEMAHTILSTNPIMKMRVASGYRFLGEYQKAKEILEELIADENYKEFAGYYTLAKEEFYASNYERAITLFDTAISYCDSEEALLKVMEFKEKAQKHLINGTKKINYQAFKKTHHKLQVGHLVYLKTNNIAASSSDLNFYRRTYLVTRIDENKISALALSNAPVPTSIELPKDICHNPTNKYVINKTATFSDEEIENIVGIVDIKYVREILYRLYYSYHEESPLQLGNVSYKGDISNVLVIYNPEAAREEYYFVLDINDFGYKVIKLNVMNGAFFPTGEPQDIGFDTYIYDILPLHPRIVAHISDYLGTPSRR